MAFPQHNSLKKCLIALKFDVFNKKLLLLYKNRYLAVMIVSRKSYL